MHTDFSIQNEPSVLSKPSSEMVHPLRDPNGCAVCPLGFDFAQDDAGGSGQGWWSLTADGSHCGAVRGVPVRTVRAYLKQLAENLEKLSPAGMKKGTALFAVPLVGNKNPLGESF